MKTMITTIALIASFAFSFANAAPLNLNRKGIAIKGCDPVAYFTEGKATKGDAKLAVTHQGAIYHFANAQHQAAFKKSPGRYTPAYGGHCAYGVSIGKLINIDPKVFTIHNGRLLLQVNQKFSRKFSADLVNNVALADKNWRDLSQR